MATNKEAMLANLMPKPKKAIPQPIAKSTPAPVAQKPLIPQAEAIEATQQEVVATEPVVSATRKPKTQARATQAGKKGRFNLILSKDVFIAFKLHILTSDSGINGSQYMENLIKKDLGL